jgi:hypothetical protein
MTTTATTKTAKQPVILAARRELRGPTPPWIAITATLLALGSFAWWLLYTWNVLPPLNHLGPWNYLVSLGLVLSAAGLMRFWRGA